TATSTIAIVCSSGIASRTRRFVAGDRKSTRLNSSHANISYAVFCLKKISIYEYLKKSFVKTTQKPRCLFFIVSKLLGAAGPLYLAASLIQFFVFHQFTTVKLPFALSV